MTIFRGLAVVVVTYMAPFLPSPTTWPHAARNAVMALRISGQKPRIDDEEATNRTSLSVIVPLYNEKISSVKRLLSHVQSQAQGEVEIIFVDAGGSKCSIQEEVYGNVRVLQSTSGRGEALKTGAEASKGQAVMFLHADCDLPKSFDVSVRQALKDEDVLLTAFSFSVNKESPHDESRFSFLERFTNLRAKLLWLPYGDQALAMRKQSYDEVGGIKALKMMEDVDLVARVRRRAIMEQKKVVILDDKVTCSNRRWKANGILKNSLLNWTFLFLFQTELQDATQIYDWYY